MTDADFLRAILARPDDDGPRLLYADWLEERGDPRGEFIRVQCALAVRLTYPLRGSAGLKEAGRRVRLQRRERELLGREAAQGWSPPHLIASNYSRWEWEGPTVCYYGRPDRFEPREGVVGRATFRRGFVEQVECTAAAFLQHAGALTAAAPIRAVRLTTWPLLVMQGGWQSALETRFWLEGDPEPTLLMAGEMLCGRRRPAAAEETEEEIVRALLRVKWSKIDFTLPPFPSPRGARCRSCGDSLDADVAETVRLCRACAGRVDALGEARALEIGRGLRDHSLRDEYRRFREERGARADEEALRDFHDRTAGVPDDAFRGD